MDKKRTSYRLQLRATFLAFIMVISVVGMSVAFTGVAVAAPSDSGNSDGPLVSGGTNWQGQELFITDLSNVNSAGDELQIRNYDRTDDEIGSLVEEFDADNEEALVDTTDLDGNYVITNSTATSTAIVFDSSGSATDTATGSSELDSKNPDFEVNVHNIRTLAFDEDVVDNGEDSTVELELDANRGSSSIYNISADGDLDDSELFELFTNKELSAAIDDGNVSRVDFTTVRERNVDEQSELFNRSGDGSDWAIGVYADTADDFDEKVFLYKQGDTQADTYFSGIDTGDYEFTFEAIDSTAEATVSITVVEEDVDGAFSQGTYSAGVGDIAHFEFELEDTDEAWLQIGDADADFVDILYVKADDEDEPIEIAVNTRLLGAPGPTVNTDAVYNTENTDAFHSLLHDADSSDILGTSDELVHNDGDRTNDVRHFYDELDLVSSDDISSAQPDGDEIREHLLNRPLQAIDYELQLAGDGDDDGIFDSDAGAGEASDQLDAAVLELQAASIGETRTWVAPSDDADDETDVDELLEIVTERDEVADGDRLVVEVEATGLYGGLIAGGSHGADNDQLDPAEVDFDRLEDGVDTRIVEDFFRAENIDFDIEAEDVTGQNPISVELDSDDEDVYMLIHPDQDRFFLIVNSDSDDAFSGSAPASKSFTAEIEFDADDEEDRFDFRSDRVADDNSPFAPGENYPYLRAGETLTGSAAFEFVESAISFDNLDADDRIQAENIEDSEITGTTNIAPGSDATIRVSSTDASTSFRIGQDVDIEEDGTMTAAFDFSSQEVGDEFDTRFRASGSTIDTVSSVIVEEGTLGVADPVDDEDDVVDDDDDVVDDDDDVVDDDGGVVDDDDVDDETDDETPGFGALVALVALIGAALLAARRNEL